MSQLRSADPHLDRKRWWQTNSPKARLVQESKTTPVGGSVTLSCSVENSAGWKYDWFRRTSTSREVPFRTNYVNKVIRVSQGGIYRCRGSRGEPAVYTDMSDDVTCEITFTNKVVVVRRPDWPQIFRGERITLTCEVQGGETTEWTYGWRRSGSYTQWSYEKTWTFTASESSSGDYTCKTRRRDDPYSSTETSEAVRLSLSPSPPVLTVSPSWLSPGASVTLSCEVKHPSTGWSFYWYKALPQLSKFSYIYELLPGSTNGTSQDSYIIDGQTHTAGYACRAGRGDPVIFTLYSQTKMVWSAGQFLDLFMVFPLC
ncbi:uncharacterized protein FYW49_012849 [Xenentodon cancila]